MKLNYIIAITILLIFGCDKKEKWKGASSHFKITRQESFNYSEMLSGELDSVKKSELEKFKDREILKNQKEESVSFTEEEVTTLGHWSTPWFQLENKKKEIHPSAMLQDEQTIMTPPDGKTSEYSEILENISSEIKVLTAKLLQIILTKR